MIYTASGHVCLSMSLEITISMNSGPMRAIAQYNLKAYLGLRRS